MFDTMTTNIEDSRLNLESLSSNAKLHVDPDSEEDNFEIKAFYQAATA